MYRDQLVAIGFGRDKIEINFVPDQIFRPLARFIRRTDVELKRYGVSIGCCRRSTAMFDWWGRVGVVRGCIVIAKK
jgi:hypothetical protein